MSCPSCADLTCVHPEINCIQFIADFSQVQVHRPALHTLAQIIGNKSHLFSVAHVLKNMQGIGRQLPLMHTLMVFLIPCATWLLSNEILWWSTFLFILVLSPNDIFHCPLHQAPSFLKHLLEHTHAHPRRWLPSLYPFALIPGLIPNNFLIDSEEITQL